MKHEIHIEMSTNTQLDMHVTGRSAGTLEGDEPTLRPGPSRAKVTDLAPRTSTNNVQQSRPVLHCRRLHLLKPGAGDNSSGKTYAPLAGSHTGAYEPATGWAGQE